MTRLAAVALVALAALGLSSCDDASAQDPIDITTDMLPCSTSAPAAGEPWESSAWPPESATVEECRWFAFDGRQSYRVSHPLGRVPRSVVVYLSFDSDGRSSNVAPGDATRIVSVQESVVEIRNATAQDFFAKVVLE